MRVLTTIPAALLLVGIAAAASATETGRPASREPVRCTANVVHPMSVRVTALDPIARGALVHLRVTASSAAPVDNAEVRLTSATGAASVGATRAALGSLAPGRTSQAIFTVAIPSTGGRGYVQFQVSGQGAQGRLTRGGCYNLLPDGPAEVGRVVVTPQGARVMEFAARRID
jgi:hypothetical protein